MQKKQDKPIKQNKETKEAKAKRSQERHVKARVHLNSALIAFLLGAAILTGAADKAIPGMTTTAHLAAANPENVTDEPAAGGTASAKVFGIPIKEVEIKKASERKLIPCGDVFGVKFFTKGVLIVGLSDVESEEGILDPAYRSGLRIGDVLQSVDGIAVNTVEEVSELIETCGGKALRVTFDRDGKCAETTLLPVKSLTDGKYKTGLWIRDSTAGIGTVTYFDPDTGEFAGLGHGICDSDTGKRMPLLRGSVVDITVTDIVKGLDGAPGEIKGRFGTLRVGEIWKNTDMGVFGTLDKAPKCAFSEPVELCPEEDVHEGEALLYTSLGDDRAKAYTIELTKIYHSGQDTKNFIFSVTDKALLARTGGIVQGMSGSPIVQDGKLVGAVTHVLINDPKKGYGIFIGNMLKNAA